VAGTGNAHCEHRPEIFDFGFAFVAFHRSSPSRRITPPKSLTCTVTRRGSTQKSGAQLSPRHRALVYLLRFDAGIDHSVLP
jgi:hypothetical protein